MAILQAKGKSKRLPLPYRKRLENRYIGKPSFFISIANMSFFDLILVYAINNTVNSQPDIANCKENFHIARTCATENVCLVDRPGKIWAGSELAALQ